MLYPERKKRTCKYRGYRLFNYLGLWNFILHDGYGGVSVGYNTLQGTTEAIDSHIQYQAYLEAFATGQDTARD